MLHCSPDVKVKAIGQHCIVLSCGMIIKCRVAFNNACRKIINILVSPSGVVLV